MLYWPTLTTGGWLRPIAAATEAESVATRLAEWGSSGVVGGSAAFHWLVGAKNPLPGTGKGAGGAGVGAATGDR